MSLGNNELGGLPYEVRKTVRLCCCGAQFHITDSDVQKLAMHPEWQLCNLEDTFKPHVAGHNIQDIREFFHDSQVPFKYKSCPRGSMTCCGSCTRVCNSRCPQDVLNRAFLLCANIVCVHDKAEKQRRYDAASTEVQLLYDEFTSETPMYFRISAMVTEMTSPCFNKKLEREIGERYGNEDSPHRLDYAPVIEVEQIPGTRPEEGKFRKKVDVETGEVSVLHWPRSGMCPFCLPTGLSERRRTR